MGALLAAIAFLGLGYGCLWSLQPLIVSAAQFGTRNYGSKYATLAIAAVAGSAPLTRLVVPHLYLAHADEEGWCIGPECFRGSLVSAGFACALGALCAWVLEAVSDKGYTGLPASSEEDSS